MSQEIKNKGNGKEKDKEKLPSRDVALPAEMHRHGGEEEEEGEGASQDRGTLDAAAGEEEDLEDQETGGGYEEDEEETNGNGGENEGQQAPRSGLPPRAQPALASSTRNRGQEPVDTRQPNQSAVQEAINRANDESQVHGGRPAKRMEDEQERGKGNKPSGSRFPIMDIDSMSREEMVAALRRLQSQPRGGGVPLQKAIRWNDGTDPNIQNGETVSARDTGSISVYGFGRRPLTLYASQWVMLAHYMPDILHFIEKRIDDMNDYVAKRLGNRSKGVRQEDVESALRLFVMEQEQEQGNQGDQLEDASAARTGT